MGVRLWLALPRLGGEEDKNGWKFTLCINSHLWPPIRAPHGRVWAQRPKAGALLSVEVLRLSRVATVSAGVTLRQDCFRVTTTIHSLQEKSGKTNLIPGRQETILPPSLLSCL